MKTRELIFCLASALVVLPGAQAKTVTPQEPKASESPVILRIEQREHSIVVKSQEGVPIYTVRDKAGKILAEDVHLEHLKAKSPEAYRVVKEAMAGQEGFLDARVDSRTN